LQVNGWNFKRITQPGPDFNAYWHELFLRGLPHMCAKMKRPQKNELECAKAAPAEDPNFYHMPPLPPTESDSTERYDASGVDRSTSMSSVSCEAFAKSNQQTRLRSEYAAGVHQNLSGVDSWDVGQHRTSEVAVNLHDFYEKEAKPKPNSQLPQLSEADLHYLIQQNRELISEAHMYQSRSRHS
jgi:hypothetical protein